MTSYIYDNKVAIISSRREDFAMTMESEEFATMQRNLFEVFWASCPAQPRQYSMDEATTSGSSAVESGNSRMPKNGTRTRKSSSPSRRAGRARHIET
jgi:hypothetical protein